MKGAARASLSEGIVIVGTADGIVAVATEAVCIVEAAVSVVVVVSVIIIIVRKTGLCGCLLRPAIHQRSFCCAACEPVAECQLQLLKKFIRFFMCLDVVSILIGHPIREG